MEDETETGEYFVRFIKTTGTRVVFEDLERGHIVHALQKYCDFVGIELEELEEDDEIEVEMPVWYAKQLNME